MKELISTSQLCFVISSLLFFCIALVLSAGGTQVLYAQKCYNDPDSPSKPCNPTPQAGDSVTQTAPPQENELIDPGVQASEPTEEPSDQTQTNNDDTNQDQNDNTNDDKQQDNTNQDQKEKKNKNSGSNDDNPGPSKNKNEKNTGHTDTSTLIDNRQNNDFSKLFLKSQSRLSNCSNSSNQSDIFSNSSTGTLEVIFYGSTSPTNPINIQLSPNPYTLDKTPLFIRDNQEGDCNDNFDVLSLPHIRYSFYTVKQLDEYGNIVRSFQIPVNKQWPFISVSIQNKTFTKVMPEFEVVPNQYLVALNDNVVASTRDVASSFASQTNAKILKVFDKTRAFVFSIKDKDIDKIDQILSSDSRIKLAEQNVIGRLAQLESSQAIPSGVKRVISGATQFGLYTSASSQGQVDADIGILDTGIDLDHPDLNVYRNISFVNGTILGNDDNGHGSEVAGIAAAKNNMLGVVGMAPGAKLWSIKVCTAIGKCPLSSQIEGIEYAIEHSDEIDVLNISIENPFSSVLNSSIARATEKGLIVVAASGNDAKDASNISPANSPDVISVSGLADSDGKCGGLGPNTTYGKDDTLADFSNFGEVIDIASPAVDILTTYNNSDYAVDSGTSFAAPHVSGAAALIKSENKNITVEGVRDRLINIGSSPYTKCDGKGRGYFLNDPDLFREHLLYLNGTIRSGSDKLHQLGGSQLTGLPTIGFRHIAK